MRDNRVGDTFFRQVGPRLPRVNAQEQAGAHSPVSPPVCQVHSVHFGARGTRVIAVLS